jgi:tetratricopeptide (TPR) repeat protein
VEARDLAEQKQREALEQRRLALTTLGDLVTNVQAEIGRLHGQEELQKQLLKIAIDGLKRVSENPAAKISLKDSTLAAAHFGMGGIYEKLGDVAAAEGEYRLAEAAYAEQVRTDPESPRCRANQAIALMALGRVHLRRNSAGPEIRECFRKAADLLDTVEQGRSGEQFSPRTAKALRADALRWLGVLASDTDPRQGREYYQRCVELRQQVADLTRFEALRNYGAASVGLLAAPLGQGPLLALAFHLAAQREIDDARRGLSSWYYLLGGADLKLGHPASTEALYRKALELSQEMADADRNNLDALWTLAAARERLGDFYLRSKRPEPAAKEYDLAAQIFQDLVARDPNRVARKDDLSRILYSVATAALQRGEQSLAAEKYRACLAIRQARTRGPKDGAYRDYMITLARCGEYQRAARMAREVRETSGKDLNSLIDVACCFAICSDLVAPQKQPRTPEQDRLRQELAQGAVEAVRTAVALGYRNVYNLDTEPDPDAVRDHPGFQAIVEELNRARLK